jgi:HAD superfamily hydrolase (TIGR01509 family)
MIKPQAILFDLDGVLVDACDWHFDALNESLQEVVGFTISLEDHHSIYNGLPTKVKLNMLGIDERLQKRIWDLKQSKTLEIISKNANYDKTKADLLVYIKNQNIQLACVTNSIKETATHMLKCTGILNYFDLLVTNEDVEKNKPFPDCYLFAFEKLNLNPNNCICVEDSDKGIAAATNSGCKYVWKVPNAKTVNLVNFTGYLNIL